MLTSIATVLIFVWLISFFGFHILVLGGFIHILLVVAIILFLLRIIRGENPLR